MLWRFELKSRWKIKLKSVFNSSLPSSCWMISSSNNATVCSLPSRWEMYDWLMFRMVTVSGTQTLCICICVRPFSHHGNLVSHNNTVTGWNNTNAHTHTHTHTYWREQVSRLLFLPGCLLLRDKALFYVEKGWDWERGLCQRLESPPSMT